MYRISLNCYFKIVFLKKKRRGWRSREKEANGKGWRTAG